MAQIRLIHFSLSNFFLCLSQPQSNTGNYRDWRPSRDAWKVPAGPNDRTCMQTHTGTLTHTHRHRLSLCPKDNPGKTGKREPNENGRVLVYVYEESNVFFGERACGLVCVTLCACVCVCVRYGCLRGLRSLKD